MPTGGGATLYVRSEKEVTPTNIGARSRMRLTQTGIEVGEYKSRAVLSEDQQAIVDLVRRVAQTRHVSVRLIDLGKARHFLERRRAKEMRWTDFPVLVVDSGKTLAGSAAFSDETVIEALTSGTYTPR